MRFELRTTADGSLTVFDHEAGECFKSRHAARLEAEHVFYRPAVLENTWLGNAQPFRVLELGFGLGTNFLHFLECGYQGEFVSIERDLSGAEFFLEQEKNQALAALVEKREIQAGGMRSKIIIDDFQAALRSLKMERELFHAILFDPFSPKANPEAWTAGLFRLAADVLAPGGRLVTYSVSRVAKDSAVSAGLVPEKRDLPPELQKRSALVAIKPAST